MFRCNFSEYLASTFHSSMNRFWVRSQKLVPDNLRVFYDSPVF